MSRVIPRPVNSLEPPNLQPNPNHQPSHPNSNSPSPFRISSQTKTTKETHLISRPPTPNTFSITLHLLPLILEPFRQPLVIVHILGQNPPTPPFHSPKNPVSVIAVCPVKGAVLGSSDTAGGVLFDVDVGGGGLFVLRYTEGDGGEGDGFAEKPAHALLVGG